LGRAKEDVTLEKSIPVIIMLIAGITVSIACIVFGISLLNTLAIVLFVLLGFFIIGRIVLRVVTKINEDAVKRANELAEEEERRKKEEEEKNAEEQVEEGEAESPEAE